MASLTITEAGKKYGEVRAISNVSLSVGDGEFLVLVGPSGCGKSTLLRMIAGLEGLTEGRVILGDRDVSDVDPRDRDVAMVFQNYALYPHMTVYENMAFGLQQRKVSGEKIREAVMGAARILGLGEFMDRKPGALSGGQRQRVAMGRAIVRDPAIYLMDEPLSNLDAKLRVRMRAELKLLRKRLGVTTIYVTHDQIEAMTLGDRVAVLSPHSPDLHSSLQQCDSPQQLYLEPRNMFVAGFIGSPAMNLLDGRVAGIADGRARVRIGETDIDVPARDGLTSDASLTLGIRPEHMTLGDSGLPATVRVVEPTGSEMHVIFECQGVEIAAVFRERHSFQPGDRVHLGMADGHVHIFAGQAGTRLDPAPA